MRRRLAILGMLATLIQLTPHGASAADVSIVAVGMTEFHFPGTPGCNTPMSLVLKTSGSDFVYRGLLAGGTPQTPAAEVSPCPLVFFQFSQSNLVPVNRTCANVPGVGPTGSITGPSTLSVSGSTYTITDVSTNCANTTVRTVNRLVLSGANSLTYSLGVYLGGSSTPTYWADGTLTRASA